MKLNLVYRDIFGQPNHKYFKKFDNESILEWFQELWQYYNSDEEIFYHRIKEYIGADILLFQTNILNIEKHDVWVRETPPQSYTDIIAYLKHNREAQIMHKQDALQVYVDEGEIQASYYLFSDEYAQKNMDKCSYLIYPNWELPETSDHKRTFEETLEGRNNIKVYPKGQNKGVTYICVFSNWTHMTLGDTHLKKQLIRIEGERLDNLNLYLKNNLPNKDWNLDLIFLRTQIENDSFAETLLNYSKTPDFYIKIIEYDKDFDFNKLISKDIEVGKEYILNFYEKHKEELDNAYYEWGNDFEGHLFNQSKFQISPHLIQASIHTQTWTWNPVSKVKGRFPRFDHFIIFDDLWGAANPDLANSILNFTIRWNVLK